MGVEFTIYKDNLFERQMREINRPVNFCAQLRDFQQIYIRFSEGVKYISGA